MNEQTYPIWSTKTAKALAGFAHMGQVDKNGAAYIEHPIRVAQRVFETKQKMTTQERSIAVQVAYLHDVLEDTLVNEDILERLGCPGKVVLAVRRLTRRRGVGSGFYYANIKSDPIALLVKEADIADNLAVDRLAQLDESTRYRLVAKYTKAQIALGLV